MGHTTASRDLKTLETAGILELVEHGKNQLNALAPLRRRMRGALIAVMSVPNAGKAGSPSAGTETARSLRRWWRGVRPSRLQGRRDSWFPCAPWQSAAQAEGSDPQNDISVDSGNNGSSSALEIERIERNLQCRYTGRVGE